MLPFSDHDHVSDPESDTHLHFLKALDDTYHDTELWYIPVSLLSSNQAKFVALK